MSRVPPAGYLSYLSQHNWSAAMDEARTAIRGLQDEVRQIDPSHPLLGLVAVTDEGIEMTPEFNDFSQHLHDKNPKDTFLYDIGRYLEQLALVLS